MEKRSCKNCKQDFSIEPDNFSFYEKIKVPPPTWCPACRFQRRLLFRNERNYYRRMCGLCNRNIISTYFSELPFPVYCQKCWWGDGWDPKSYGRDFDFNRTFAEQYKALQNVVPAVSIMNDDGVASVNCEYTYDWAFSKNCYLGVCGWHVENGLYMYCANYDKDVMDVWDVNYSELVYDSVNCDRCYGCKYCYLCFDSNNCAFGYDLKGCSNCVMCVGLRNKKYCISNKQYSKEEYEKEVEKLNLKSRANIEKCRKEFDKFIIQFPRKYTCIIKNMNSTGFLLTEAKNSKNCFYCSAPVENCAYIVVNHGAKDSYDCNNTGMPELCYESVTPDNSRGNKFSIFCWKCTEAEYSNNCHSCVNVFGSIGLKHTSYAILNKQYSKEDFIDLRGKIIKHMKETGEWGEFFPYSVSPFAYNETAAMEWFPLKKEEAVSRGYRWKENEKRNYTITKNPEELPDSIEQVGDEILNEIIGCEHAGGCNEKCTTAFKIVPNELNFYRMINAPLPTLCSNCRHYGRMARINPPKLWKRKCMCADNTQTSADFTQTNTDTPRYRNVAIHSHGEAACQNEFETSYAPDRPEIVYCESCYNSEIA